MTTPADVMIVTSSRFYETARPLAAELRAAGLTVNTPDFDFDETRVVVCAARKAELTRAALRKVAHARVTYVLCEEGYVGLSVALEVGYAHALGRRIVASRYPVEDAVRALVNAYVSPRDLGAYLTLRGMPTS